MSTQCNNYINILITTNHERPVLVETSDRRFVLFKASDVHLKTPKYYIDLANHLQSPEVARAFYQFLMARDLSRYISNFQASRPMTDYYLQSRQSSISTINKFISGIINAHYSSSSSAVATKQVLCHGFFKDFVRFLEVGRYQSTMTMGTFTTKIKNIKGITSITADSQGSPRYVLNFQDIRDGLIENHEYDQDIFFE